MYHRSKYHYSDCDCASCKAQRENALRVKEILELRDRQKQEEDKRLLEKIDARKVGGVFGNEVWNPKRKRWENLGGAQFIFNHKGLSALSFFVILVIIVIIVNVILHFLSPGTSLLFFFW